MSPTVPQEANNAREAVAWECDEQVFEDILSEDSLEHSLLDPLYLSSGSAWYVLRDGILIHQVVALKNTKKTIA